MAPETHYAKADDGTSIAYQVVGDGPLDLVFIPGWVSHLDLDWEIGGLARFIDRLTRFGRVIRLDRRGTGLSDRVPSDALPTLEQRMDDVGAVLDAVGSEQAALFGVSEGGPMSLLFAATYPRRTVAVVLYGAHATEVVPGDEGLRARIAQEPDALASEIEASWGQGFGLEYFSPSLARLDGAREVWARYQRAAASPSAAVSIIRMSHASTVDHILPSIRVPVLVLHRRGDRAVGVAHGRYLATRIPGARYIELEGEDHFWHVGDADSILDATEEFLTGTAPPPSDTERQLATVLFTDIVGSTDHAATVGDRAWSQVLADHDALVRRLLQRFHGHEVKHTGDGFLATFDGPGRAIRCAQAVVDGARALGIEVRAGLHTGECEIRGADIGGIAVHIAARVAALAASGEVLVSASVPPLVVGSSIEFDHRGEHELKGVPGTWQLYAAMG